MKIVNFILSFALITTAYAQNNTWQNIISGQGSGNENIASFGVDSANNTIAVVRYNGDSMLWGSTVIKEKTLRWNTTNLSQPVIVKSKQNGEVIWVKTFEIIDSSNNFAPLDIIVNKDGSSLIYLSYGGKANMKLILGQDTVLPFQGLTGPRINSLVKLNPKGEVVWHLDINPQRAFLTLLNQDGFGNIFLGGTFTNGTNSIKFDTLTLNNPHPKGFMEGFVVKLNSNGKVIWGNTFGGKYTESPYDLDFDNSGNVYISSNYSSDTVFFGNDTLIHPTGGAAIFPNYTCIAKFSHDGTPLWARNFLSRNVLINCIRNVKSEKGNQVLSVVGYSELHSFKVDTFSLGKGPFLLNYNLDGTLKSAIHFSDTILGFRNHDIINAISDTSGNLYIAGAFSHDSLMLNGKWEKNFNPGSATKDVYAIKFDTANVASLQFHVGGDDDDAVDKFRVSEAGSIMLACNYKSNSFYLDTTELTNSAFPNRDMFLASFAPAPNNSGIPKLHGFGQLDIYPNPASDVIYVNLEFKSGAYSVISATGTVVKSGTWTNSGSQSVQISALPAGTYFIRAESGSRAAVSRFIKL